MKKVSSLVLKKPKKKKSRSAIMAFMSTPHQPIINANKVRNGKEYQGECETKCNMCKVDFDLDDMVVNCSNEHTFHRNCFEGRVENVKECPLCFCSMLFEDDYESASELKLIAQKSSLRSLSPKRKRK